MTTRLAQNAGVEDGCAEGEGVDADLDTTGSCFPRNATEWVDFAIARQGINSLPVCNQLEPVAPDGAEFWCDIASELVARGLTRDAADAYRCAIGRAHKSGDAFSILVEAAGALMSMSDPDLLDSAYEAYKSSARIRTDSLTPVLGMAQVRIRQGKQLQALSLIEQALTLHISAAPSLDWPLEEYPSVRYEDWDMEEELDIQSLAAIRDWYDLAWAYLHRDYSNEAIRCFARSMADCKNPAERIGDIAVALSNAKLLPGVCASYED